MPSYVVTGTSRGLGYAWIKHLAATPTNTVIGIARNKPFTDAKLAADGIHNVHILSADVTDIAALRAAAAATAEITGGGLDYLIHNAAFISPRSGYLTLLEDTPEGLEEDLMSLFRANVVGSAHTIAAFLPLIRQGSVKKVIVSSTGFADLEITTAYDIAIAGPYAISKAAVNALVAKYHAAAGRAEGILFLALSPGVVDTREPGKVVTEAEMAGMQAMGAKFAKYAPEFKGPIGTVESVERQVAVIERASVEEFGGAFVSHFGNKQWL